MDQETTTKLLAACEALVARVEALDMRRLAEWATECDSDMRRDVWSPTRIEVRDLNFALSDARDAIALLKEPR